MRFRPFPAPERRLGERGGLRVVLEDDRHLDLLLEPVAQGKSDQPSI
jgi:hypothetical protein